MARSTAAAPVPLGRARLSRNDPRLLATSFPTIIPPPDHERNWRLLDLDRHTFERINPAKLLEYLTNLSPELSRALWDFLLMFDAGHEAHAFRIGTEDEDSVAQAALDAFLDRLTDRHGSVSVLTHRIGVSLFLRGALFVELVLDNRGREPLDLAVPDPASVRFRKDEDPELGEVWMLGQWQGGEFVVLDRPTIRYVPLHPLPGSPYGRSIAAPALFPCLFLLGLMHDLRRVVAQQGYPRIDLKIITETIKQAFESDDDDDKFKARVDEIVAQIMRAYEQLEPDDAFVHPDWVEVQRSVGAVDASAIGAADSLLRAIERMATRALKSMPLLMGDTQGAAEANANRQWELYAKGVKSVQHLAERVLERLFTIALNAQGIQADVSFKFTELRAAEEHRDELTQQLKLSNADYMERLGFKNHDEASEYAVGHPAHGERLEAAAQEPDEDTSAAEETEPEVGEDRLIQLAAALHDALVGRAERADLPALPETVEITETDADNALALWNAAMEEERGLLDADVVEDDEETEA